MYQIKPFVLLGAGALGASSSAMGTDTDPAIHFGVGAKVAFDAYISARPDVRDTLLRSTAHRMERRRTTRKYYSG